MGKLEPDSGKIIIDGKLQYTHSRDSNVDTFSIVNNSDKEVSCSITLTENFTVEITSNES
jgi:hypothetical protein